MNPFWTTESTYKQHNCQSLDNTVCVGHSVPAGWHTRQLFTRGGEGGSSKWLPAVGD